MSEAENYNAHSEGKHLYRTRTFAESEHVSCGPWSEHTLNPTSHTRLHEHAILDSHPMWLGGRANPWRVLVDTSYSINENALRFLPSAAEVRGVRVKGRE